jgi:hypothetical protein
MLEYEEIDPKSDLYRENFVWWLDRFLEQQVESTIDFSKPRSHDLLQKKWVRLVKEYDFNAIVGYVPEEFLVWSIQHKRAIEEFSARICVELGIFSRYLFVLTRALNDFDRDQYEGPEQQITKQCYDHMFLIFKVQYPEKALFIEALLHKAQNQTETARPSCPECSSDHITSNGPLWFCQSCGRKWTKNPRRQKA